MKCVTVRSPEDMARLLREASPVEAPHFARAEHEKACAGDHQGAEAFWRRVMEALAAPAMAEMPGWHPRRPLAERPARTAFRAGQRLPRGMVSLARH